jgi:hypothetical protein
VEDIVVLFLERKKKDVSNVRLLSTTTASWHDERLYCWDHQPVAARIDFSNTKGSARAKLLWAVRMGSLLLMAKPLSC